MNIIVADGGSSKTRLVGVDTDGPEDVLCEASYNSCDFDSFVPLLKSFIAESGNDDRRLAALSLGLHAVVNGSEAKLKSLPWILSKKILQAELGVEQIHYKNDFQASVPGISQLKTQDLNTVNRGVHKDDATCVTVGAGTGPGLSSMLIDGATGRAWPTEGGLIIFAAVDETQIEQLRLLIRHHGHVSYSRQLYGEGLVILYEFSEGEENSINVAAIDNLAKENNEAASRAISLFVTFLVLLSVVWRYYSSLKVGFTSPRVSQQKLFSG